MGALDLIYMNEHLMLPWDAAGDKLQFRILQDELGNNNNYIYRALNTGVSKRTGGLSNWVSFIYTCV